MKAIFAILFAMTSIQAHAAAPSISCKGSGYGNTTITLKAGAIQLWNTTDQTGRMVNAVMTYSVTDGKTVSTDIGRAQYWESDAKYNPRKYKDHWRFDAMKLTDVKTFGAYVVDNTCALYVMVPKTILKSRTAKLPVTATCEQGGGTIVMNCTVTPDLN